MMNTVGVNHEEEKCKVIFIVVNLLILERRYCTILHRCTVANKVTQKCISANGLSHYGYHMIYFIYKVLRFFFYITSTKTTSVSAKSFFSNLCFFSWRCEQQSISTQITIVLKMFLSALDAQWEAKSGSLYCFASSQQTRSYIFTKVKSLPFFSLWVPNLIKCYCGHCFLF